MNMNLEKYLKLRYIYILSILFCIYLTYIFRVDITFDTPTYVNAWSTLLDGHIDKWRTPSYPIFLGIMKTIFGDNYLYFVVLVQHLVFLVSVRYFYLLTRCTVTNDKISFFITLFYALYPCVATYNCLIGTSTFVVTGSVFLLYTFLKFYLTNHFRYGVYAFFLLFFLIFLRPAVVYLLPVTIVAWCIVAYMKKNFLDTSVLFGITGSVVVSICLIVYMFMFKSSYGVFTPSGIGLINQYTVAKAANVIDLNTTGEELGFYQEAEKYINIMGMEAFSDSLKQSINRDKGKYVKRLWQNVRKASEDNLFEPSYQIGVLGVFSNLMGPKIKVIYYLFLIYAVLLLRWMMRRKEIAIFPCFLIMIGVSNYIIIILGSPGEYGRLSLPAMPVYLIMFGQLLNMIRIKRISNVRFV